MKRMRKTLGAILGAGLLVVVGGMFGPRTAHAVVAALVNVVNTQANPVPVREANSPDIYPFVLQFCTNPQATGECTISGDNNGGSTTIPTTTPDNVVVLFADIDNFSSVCFFGSHNAADQLVDVFTVFQGNLAEWGFIVPHINTDFATVNQGTRIYADPGSTINVSLNGSIPHAQSCAVTLSGHLVTR
jgi:hypothetical protein